MNPVDTKVRTAYNQPKKFDPPQIVGYDGSGIIEEIGSEVKYYKVGDLVYFAGSRARQGCHAEFVIIDERIVGIKPKSLSFEEAASIPLTGITAWEGMVEQMRIPIPNNNNNANSEPQKSILIVGGAGGVGTIAIQIAKSVLKLKVIATASKEESANLCKKLGADFVVNHFKDLKEELKSIGFEGIDYILETNKNLDKNFDTYADILNPLGAICSILPPTGALNVGKLFLKRGILAFEFMFARPINQKELDKQREILDELSRLADQKIIDHRAFKIFESINETNIREAHKLAESGSTLGKICLTAKFD